MKICLVAVGKTQETYLVQGIERYIDRLKHYTSFEFVQIQDIKNASKLTQNEIKIQEGKLITGKFLEGDEIYLLDELGKTFRSIEFADFLNDKQIYGSAKRIVFVIGGPYGFSQEVYSRARGKISLSTLTFSHQMVRLFFVEQLYRAFTIIKGEPYHHE